MRVTGRYSRYYVPGVSRNEVKEPTKRQKTINSKEFKEWQAYIRKELKG